MKFTKIAAIISVTALLITGCSTSKTAISVGDITATKGDVEFLINDYNSQLGNFETAKEYATKAIKDAMLIKAVAKANGIELSADDIKTVKQTAAQVKSNYGGASAFKKALKETGATEDFVSIILEQSFYKTALSNIFTVADPSDEDLKKYMTEKYRRAKHVLIQVGEDVVTGDLEKTEAEKILKQAQDGADFDALIKEHSDDPGSESNPDGYVFTDNEMVKEFQDGVDSIKPGEFTMVKSDYGYHVIQRLALDESDSKFNDLFTANKEAALASYKSFKFDEQVENFAKENGIEFVVDEDAIASIVEKVEETDEATADEEAAQ